MKRFLWLAIFLGGCEFTGDSGGGGGADDAPTDAPVTVERKCTAVAPTEVRLCIDFEDPSLTLHALDGSGLKNDATATLITPMRRPAVGGAEQAAQLTGQSSLHVAETANLDLTSFTIEMWIQPQLLPQNDLGLLDNDGQYTMLYDRQGQVRCGLTDSDSVGSNVALTRNAWHHVACRHDNNGDMKVFVDGDVSDCKHYSEPVSTTSTAGTAIGARITLQTDPLLPVLMTNQFSGGIDNVRVYRGAIDEARLCAAAGRQVGGQNGCDFSCPPSDGSGKGHGHQGGD